jgi:hypothetical protein
MGILFFSANLVAQNSLSLPVTVDVFLKYTRSLCKLSVFCCVALTENAMGEQISIGIPNARFH